MGSPVDRRQPLYEHAVPDRGPIADIKDPDAGPLNRVVYVRYPRSLDEDAHHRTLLVHFTEVPRRELQWRIGVGTEEPWPAS